MLYAIIFVLLLAVAIFLKVKENKSKEDNGKSAKRPAASKQRSTPKGQVRSKTIDTSVKTPAAAPVASNGPTPIDEKTKSTIQNHVASGNYSVAEAYINQCLNKDPSQHDLYLELLSLHLLQKDDFSAKKLLEHLESLGLTETLAQAEIKYKATKFVENPTPVANDTGLDFTPSQTPEPVSPSTQAFDELAQTEWQAPTTPKEETSQLHDVPETLEFIAPKVEKPAEDVAPLEFSFSTTPKETAPKQTATQTPIEVESPALDFSPTVEPTPVTETEEKSATEAPLSFDFGHFDAKSTPEETPVTVETPAITPAVTTESPSAFDFQLDQPASTVNESTPAPAESSAVSMDPNDPIVLNFPHVTEVADADLDLELVEQYIQLGAYSAAQQLLDAQQVLNSNQQAKADALRMQLAS